MMRDFPNELLQKNLLALSGFNIDEAALIGDTHLDQEFIVKTSKNGYQVPCISTQDRIRPLHSLFDPIKEAQRLVQSCQSGGMIIIFGFGAGYHIRELLSNPKIEAIVIIDFDYSFFRSLLSLVDVSDIFIDPRVRLFIDPVMDDLSQYLLERYIPVFMGNIRTLPLRSRTDCNELEFQKISRTIQNVIESVSDDYSVQARFGHRWISNAMANLAIAEKISGSITPKKRVMIIAAGPSLDEKLNEIKQHINEYYCIATDTALPWMLKNDLLPDIVISIDCQTITYHHFLSGIPDSVPVLFDLSSPPTLSRSIKNPLFFSSGHPFSQYVSQHWKAFPYIDTSGGNVTHAAVSFASSIGANNILLFGADYCYPYGKTYAKDTYLFNYHRSKETRFTSCESLLADFVFSGSNLQKNKDSNKSATCYSTSSLRNYRNRITKLADYLPIDIKGYSPYGPTFPQLKKKNTNNEIPFISWVHSDTNWINFLETYSKDLNTLQLPKDNITSFFANQEKNDLLIWMTLFPAAAYFRYSNNELLTGKQLLKHTIDWTILEIRKTIKAVF